MLYSYQECLEKHRNDYQIKKELAEGRLFKKEKGIYSDKEYIPELSIVAKKYPDAVFTMNSAFYYHGMTDTIPSKYYLATEKGKRKITDQRVKQIFENSEELLLGVIQKEYTNSIIRIYNLERMLVELIRKRSKIPFDLYKEIILNYRKEIDNLDIALITDYAYALPKTKMVLETIRREIL